MPPPIIEPEPEPDDDPEPEPEEPERPDPREPPHPNATPPTSEPQAGPVIVEYPRWLYHPSGDRKIVNTAAEAAALGDDWTPTPP